MLIEESIIIHALSPKVWDTFTDITCWKDWNTVLKNVSPKKKEVLTKGGKVRFCFCPCSFPDYFRPLIEKVVPLKKIVCSSGVYGIPARHESLFEEVKDGMLITSRERFKGFPIRALRFLLPEWRLRDLTVAFLKDLKKAAEI